MSWGWTMEPRRLLHDMTGMCSKYSSMKHSSGHCQSSGNYNSFVSLRFMNYNALCRHGTAHVRCYAQGLCEGTDQVRDGQVEGLNPLRLSGAGCRFVCEWGSCSLILATSTPDTSKAVASDALRADVSERQCRRRLKRPVHGPMIPN